MVSNNRVHSHCRESRSRFFRKPELIIEYDNKRPNIHWPARTCTFNDVTIHRQYLRVNIWNKGQGPAEHCKARLIVKPINNQKQYPSIEYVELAWGGDTRYIQVNTITEESIQPKERKLLHIIFSDSQFPSVKGDPPNPIHACILSKQNLERVGIFPVEQGFIVGEFVVEITVVSGRAHVREEFIIHVDEEWSKLSMEKMRIPLTTRIKSRFSKRPL
ncbi:MAG: hypothetical protein ACRD4W_05380 [Nitrososphaeraceae archaeon]